MRYICYSIALSIVFLLPVIALAQATGSFFVGQVNNPINTTPSAPAAFSTFSASVNTIADGLFGASIAWYINGEEQLTTDHTIQIAAGDVGESIDIRAVATGGNGEKITYKKIVTPINIAIILDAATLVPTFYKGRSEPSYGSTIKAIALVETGTVTTMNDLYFTWKLNGESLGPAARGGYVKTFSIPVGYSSSLRLEVKNSNGVTLASKTIAVPITEPELIFYENNALRGISKTAIKNNSVLNTEELTVRAEPYFMDLAIGSQSLLTEWTINGRTVQSENTNNRTITLQNPTESFISIGFHIRNLKQLLQGVERSLRVRF